MTELDDIRYLETADGLRLAYRVLGSGSPTVLAPAMGWLAEDLKPLAENRTVVFFDVRGQGRSDRADDSQVGFDRDVDDVEALRRALDLDSVTLLGWSYHGAVTTRYAHAHPDRVERIVLMGPVAPRAQPHWRSYLHSFSRNLDVTALRALEEQRRAGLKERDPIAWCRAHTELILRVYVHDDSCLARMKSSPCAAPNLDPEVVNKQMLRVIERMGEYDWRGEMTRLDVPVLILHGDRDPVPLAGSHEWVETLPNAQLEVLAGCGHLPWIEQPERFFPLVEAFLADRAAAPPETA